MNFIFSGLFWGILVILIGISIILNSVFHLNIPIFKIFFALFFIYLGISMITGTNTGHKDEKTAIFTELKDIKPTQNEFNTIFASTNIDLKDLKRAEEFRSNTVFGSTTITIDSKKPIKIIASSAFGEIKLPNKDTANFGEITYTTKSYKDDKNSIVVYTSVVFGGVEIKEQ